MTIKNINSLLSNWNTEFQEVLHEDQLLYIALFSSESELLYANKLMATLLRGISTKAFINPNFDQLLDKKYQTPLIFEGYITIGDYESINTSIFAKIYRKNKELLLIGGIEAPQLIEQNKQMHQLNREINSLQRQLIKEKKNLETALKKNLETNSELKKLNADKDLFMSVLAHDLKSPFNSLLGFSSMLLEDLHEYDMETIERQVQYINKISHKTYYLLEDLLLWSKSQAGKMPFSPSQINTYEICDDVISYLIFEAKKKDILLDYSLVENSIVFADYNMLKTILRNLISNAIKFTNKKGIIKIFSTTNNTSCIFTISDNGVGIDQESISKILNSNETFTTYSTNYEHGTGLGMNLCIDFINRHKGKLWIESELGKGSEFKFSIPKS